LNIADNIVRFFYPGAASAGVHTAEQRSRSVSIHNPASPIDEVFEQDAHGHYVNEDTAMRVATVHACIKIIAEDIAGRDIYIEQYSAGRWRRTDTHPIYNLMQSVAWTSVAEPLIGNAALSGNGVAKIYFDKKGQPADLEALSYAEFSIYENLQRRLWYYATDRTTARYQLLRDSEVLHVKGFSLDGRIGISPIKYMADTIIMTRTATEFATDSFTSGAYGGGFIETDADLDAPSRLRYARQVRKAQSLGLYPVLDKGMKLTPNKMSPADIDFINTMGSTRSAITSIYRVPLHMVTDTKAPGSNIDQNSLRHVKFCLLPWARRLEEELERKLLLPSARQNTRIKVDFTSLLRGDSAQMATYYSSMIAAQVLVPDEVREIIGYEERPDGEGNKPVDNQKTAMTANGGVSPHITSKSTYSTDEQEEQLIEDEPNS